MVHVDEGAEMSETGIENINIITGPNGKCYSKPEIDSHNETTRMRYGSQTAFIDDSMLLYLNSKGLIDSVARNLILEGFKNTVFDLIPQEELQQEVRQMFDLD
jgi:Fe-S cluster assembly protein SufD